MKDRKRLYIILSLVSVAIWILAALLSALKLPASVKTVIDITGSLAPSWLFLFACLALILMKSKFKPLDKKSQRLEDVITVLMILLSILAEVITHAKGGISFAVPLCAIAVFSSITIHIADSKKNIENDKNNSLKSKFTIKETVLVIIMGMISCVILAKFFQTIANAVMM